MMTGAATIRLVSVSLFNTVTRFSIRVYAATKSLYTCFLLNNPNGSPATALYASLLEM
jgi:hypothetical protein